MELLEKYKIDKSLNDNEKYIIQYIFEHIDEVPHISSRELGRRTFTSSTSVIRLIKKLGFENYNDFKLNIISYIKNINVENSAITPDENMLSLMNKLADMNIETVHRIKEQLSVEDINQVVSYISQSQYVDIIATDMNASMSEYFCHLLWTMGKNVNVYHESDKQLYLGLNVPRDHIVLVVSRKGKNDHILKVLKTLKKRNIKTIMFTVNQDKRLINLCTLCISCFVSTDSQKIRDIVFYTSLKYVFDLIYLSMFSHNFDESLEIENIYNSIAGYEL